MINQKKTILVSFGTRPEIIKLYPLIIELKKNFNVITLNTGQHKDLLDNMLKLFHLKVDFNLNVMKTNQDLNYLTSSIIKLSSPLLKKINPSLVIVHGDTTSSLAIALSSSYNNYKIAHVEAGLRTFNKKEPFPEELNRKILGSIADIHFAPTKISKKNLNYEGIKKNIFVTGNTIVDSVNLINKNLNKKILKHFKDLNILFKNPIILITCHRRENFNNNIKIICVTLIKISKLYPKFNLIFPLHPNPNIRNTVNKYLSNIENIFIINPLRYDHFLYLMKNSKLIISDSGGLQEECFSFNVPVILLRNYTERPEALVSGLVNLTTINSNKIIKLTNHLLKYNFKKIINPFGNGNASKKISKIIRKIII